MPNRIIYVPLEPYKERYTMQWSAPVTGWLERNWIQAKVPYVRIDGTATRREIKSGAVLDAVGRCQFAMSQVNQLIEMIEKGEITHTDVLYFDDFWHPGIECIPYVARLTRPYAPSFPMYSFLHAQSVDRYDFTFPMRSWMRDFEKGIGALMSGIFVCCDTLKSLVLQGGIAGSDKEDKVAVTGHPFSSEEVMERMPQAYRFPVKTSSSSRKDQVVWSSRLDTEKNPRFFLEVVKSVIDKNPNIAFVICTSSSQLRSNDIAILNAINDLARKVPNNLLIRTGLSKEEYYQILTESKVQFNCANQDFVAITLLESSVAGCIPVYPYFRSFPETFANCRNALYKHLDVNSATDAILDAMSGKDSWSSSEINSRSWIHKRFDLSWIRMLLHIEKMTFGGLRVFTTNINNKVIDFCRQTEGFIMTSHSYGWADDLFSRVHKSAIIPGANSELSR